MPVLSYFGSPRLYGIYNAATERTENSLESFGNSAMSFTRGIYYLVTSLAVSPMLLGYLYYRGYLQPQSMLTILRYASYVTLIAFGSRLVGRMMDPQYKQFLNVWLKASEGSAEHQTALKGYDFEIYGVKPDFIAAENQSLWYLASPAQANFLVRGLSYYAIHAFGRQMLYPGSLALLNWMMSGNLQGGRRLMVTTKQGERAWIKTTAGDLIDAMYIRGSQYNPERKKTLIICCEGNAGFYEIGVANTPASLGYSVLGWNQPGFGESTGLPFPRNTLAAADAVMQYATKELGFKEEDIVLFGWSIGGFPVAWLAANYPSVKAVILDATFDDVLPLAQARMPRMLGSVVEYAIRTHANLQIDKILENYHGPLRLIRRLQEEILTTNDGDDEAARRASNRVNTLLKSVLQMRHNDLYEDLEPQVDRWLAMTPTERLMAANMSSSELAIRRRRLFNACEHYLVDFDSNHVTPLDPGFFNIPEHRSNF